MKKKVKYKTYYLRLNWNTSLCNRTSVNVETQHRSLCGISKVMGYIEALYNGHSEELNAIMLDCSGYIYWDTFAGNG